MEKIIVSAKEAPAVIGPYSAAVKHGNLIFVSGQIPINPRTGTLPNNIEEQTRQSLDNLKAVLEGAGSALDKVLTTTVFLSNMDDFACMNKVYGQYFKENFPARSTVQVARLPIDSMIEINVIAYS